MRVSVLGTELSVSGRSSVARVAMMGPKRHAGVDEKPAPAAPGLAKMKLNTGLRIQLATCVTVGIFLCCLFGTELITTAHEPHHARAAVGPLHGSSFIRPPQPSLPKHVQELLDATMAATRAAAGGEDPPIMTPEESQNWTDSNPCRSRVELTPKYARRKWVRDMAENPLWDMVLQEYTKLHRTCMRNVTDLRAQFMDQNSSSPCKYAVADIDKGIPAGISNRILSITSVVLYSILTQRVVLVPQSTLLTSLMCEPFHGSSWNLDSYGPFTYDPFSGGGEDRWVFHQDVYDELDEGMVNHTAEYMASPQSEFFAASMALSQYHPDNRFYCDTEQASFAGIDWLYFTGCIYTVPKLFSIPSFRRTLDELFPGRFVVTQMLRSVMLPADDVWEQVVETERIHFGEEDYRVGIQIRYYYGKVHYDDMNDVFNERILNCTGKNGILPAREPSDQQQHRNLFQSSKSIRVFVASLYPGFYDHMTKNYLSLPGENVTLVQLSNNTVQKFGLAVDTESLVEIFLLSFSDKLLSTPTSTFGGLAQAYGSLTPWKIETLKGDDLPPCQHDTTVELCYQTAMANYSCPYNNVNGLRISALAPYYQVCLEHHVQEGIQLVTDHRKVPLLKPRNQTLHGGLAQEV